MADANFSTLRAFVFDLDGTLIDSQLDLINSVNFMLQEMQRTALPRETVACYIGHGAPRLVADALGPGANDGDRQQGLEIFLAHYRKHFLDQTRAYPGVMEGLRALDGLPMAVLTNKPSQMSMEILESLGLLRFFPVVYGGDSFQTKKPDPTGARTILDHWQARPEETAIVGDSDVDIQTARNAGTRAIGVNYGFGRHDRKAHPADYYVDSLRELAALAAAPS